MARLRRSKLLISTQKLGTSVTSKRSVVGQVKELFPIWIANRQRMQVLDAWLHCELTEEMLPVMPDKATDEFKRLRQTAPTPYGRLIVQSSSQNLIVDDIRMSAADASSPAYELWQRNGLDSRQVPVHEGALGLGQSYNLVLPAIGRLDGKPTAAIRGKSAIRALGFYRDDFDEYPEFFLEGEPQVDEDGTQRWRLDFYDDFAHHRLTCEWDGTDMAYTDFEPHGMDLCPVVRFANTIDLDGRVVGEVAPFITVFARIDQDTQDRLVVQRWGAWAVRTIAGMNEPATDAEKAAARIALGIGDFMVSEDPKTKFGSLPATDMRPHLEARDRDVRDLAAVSQTPSYHLLGLSDNVGAEGLAAAEAAHMRKLDVRKQGFGNSWISSLRLGGHAMGNPEIANDFESRAHWKNTRTDSFQSLTQALGNLATSLGIPPELLVNRIPDWTQVDTAEMKRLVEKVKAEAQQDAEMDMQRQIEVTRAKQRPAAPVGQ